MLLMKVMKMGCVSEQYMFRYTIGANMAHGQIRTAIEFINELPQLAFIHGE